jgi:hypothetical protein
MNFIGLSTEVVVMKPSRIHESANKLASLGIVPKRLPNTTQMPGVCAVAAVAAEAADTEKSRSIALTLMMMAIL